MVGGILGVELILGAGAWVIRGGRGLGVVLVAPAVPSRPLQKSLVQMHAMMLASSTGLGTQAGLGSMGSVMEPRRTDLEKHSRMMATSVEDFW